MFANWEEVFESFSEIEKDEIRAESFSKIKKNVHRKISVTKRFVQMLKITLRSM